MTEGARFIVAVDPGKTTGVATYRPSDGRFSSYEQPCWDAVRTVARGLGDELISAVVCESYLITASTLRKTRGENWSLESIGALRFLCMQTEVKFQLQSPSDAKGFATDHKLRLFDWWAPTPGGHRNDAARHLLTYLVKQQDPEVKLMLKLTGMFDDDDDAEA